jgi:LPXTG-motif cell wall-anchored protein
MDEQRFDNLTRLLGSGLNRRKVLRGLLGGAGALAGLSALRPKRIGAQQCRAPGEVCQINPGQGNNCCAGLICDDIDPETGNGHCGDCPSGTFCPDTGLCSDCCADSDCTSPDSCTVVGCVGGTCQVVEGGCPAGEYCCDAQGGSCAPCCSDGDCPAGTPICYNPGDPTNAFCVACVDSGDCGACQECEGFWCVDLSNCCTSDADCGECQECEGGFCVDLANCCTSDDECDPGETCVNGQCVVEVCFERVDCVNVQQPACPTLCPAGSFPGNNRALDGTCCTGNGTCCSNSCVDNVCVGGPPPPQCEDTSDCDACEVCDSGTCIPTECCYDTDCPDCEVCGQTGTCQALLCILGETCCEGHECVPEDECCKDFGDSCGLLGVTPAGGAVQLDCCDGLLCCYAKDGHVCAECCHDHDCGKDGYCRNGYCEYPKACKHDSACPKGTCCCKDGNCSSKCCNKPHPPKPPKPAKPVPAAPVTNLPATGAGESSDSTGLFGAAALGAAAALYAARKLRETPEGEPEA